MEPEVKVTESVRNILEDVINKNGKDSTTELKEIEKYVTDKEQNRSIPFKLVNYAYKIRSQDLQKLYLNEVLQDSDVVLKELTPPARNPELEARIQKLKAEQENKAYKQMTKNVDKIQFYEPGSVGKELKQLNNQLIGVFNFLVTVGGAFAFGYKGTEYAFGGEGLDTFPMQLMSGLILGTIVFFADLYFLVKEDMR